MDGRDALLFRRSLRNAEIIALEPNPENASRMRAEPSLERAMIEVVPAAAADFDGEAAFHLVPAPPGPDERDRRGMSSLWMRSDPKFAGPSVVVPVLRLDRLLEARVPHRALALWIDCEGGAFEALKGATGIAPWLQLVHVEVETQPCINPTQHLYGDVAALLGGWGFIELATNRPSSSVQFDAVYLRADRIIATRLRIGFWILALRLRRLLGDNLEQMRRGVRRRVNPIQRR